MRWSHNALNALAAIGVGMSEEERVRLAAALLRTLPVGEREHAVELAAHDEPDAHVRKTLAKFGRVEA